MCEATVFLASGGRERKIMENVVAMRPEGDCIFLADLLGEQRLVRAQIKDVDLLHHRVVLEEVPAAEAPEPR